MNLTRILRILALASLAGVAFLTMLLTGLYLYVAPQLPDASEMRDMRLTTPMQVLTRDGQLIAEFGEQRRIPVRYEDVPELVVKAFIAVEDQRFFQHGGVDLFGVLRAAVSNLTNDRAEGASTITQLVARNYFLTRERTLTRKFTEIFLARRIEAEFSKEEIMALYLNKVHFSHRAYGIVAAAQTYFGKPLDRLTVAESALLAGIPKGESIYNPLSNPKRALARRNHVLKRMQAEKFIDDATHDAAVAEPIRASYHGPKVAFDAPYLAEMVRQEMVAKLGEERAYSDGLRVYTTVPSHLQKTAQIALQRALRDYDTRHGWRGREANWGEAALGDADALFQKLSKLPVVADLDPAVVLSVEEKAVNVLDRAGQTRRIEWSGLEWARKHITENRRGPVPKTAAEIVKPGDVVRIEAMRDGSLRLAQIPDVAGAFVALAPDSGAVLALVGGVDFSISQFNRATQAKRQPGSTIKPFVYSAAFANGLSPASVLNDAPVVSENNGADDAWRPDNDAGKFYGPVRLRFALGKSLNSISARIFEQIGADALVKHLQGFGFPPDQLPPFNALALGGASEFTPMDMARGYAAFANGGYLVSPFVIDRIEDSFGKVLHQTAVAQPCESCAPGEAAPAGFLPRAVDARNAYITRSVMREVIEHGTAWTQLSASGSPLLKRGDLGGKTGTTNEARDAWFAGIHPKIAATVWVGFDDHRRPLGKVEYGGKAALPIWQFFMETALANEPVAPDTPPPGVATARIDPVNGLLAPAGFPGSFMEVFLAEQVPTQMTPRAGDDQPDPQKPHTAPANDDIF